MERAKLGVSLQDSITNEQMRQRSGVQDVIKRIATLKWNWAWTVDKTYYGVEIQKPKTTTDQLDQSVRTVAGNGLQAAQKRLNWKN